MNPPCILLDILVLPLWECILPLWECITRVLKRVQGGQKKSCFRRLFGSHHPDYGPIELILA